VLVSDFYEEPDVVTQAVVPLRARGHDVIVFHVLDPAELTFPFQDASGFEDMETEDQIPVIPAKLRDDYQRMLRAHLDDLERRFTGAGIDYTVLDTSKPRADEQSEEPVVEVQRPARRGLARLRQGKTTRRSRRYGEEDGRRMSPRPPCARNHIGRNTLRDHGLRRHGLASVVGSPRRSLGYAFGDPPRTRGRGARNAGHCTSTTGS